MYTYKIEIKKVSGRLNESVLPSRNLTIKSKTKKSNKRLFAEASAYFKKKYGLVIESADVRDISSYKANDIKDQNSMMRNHGLDAHGDDLRYIQGHDNAERREEAEKGQTDVNSRNVSNSAINAGKIMSFVSKNSNEEWTLSKGKGNNFSDKIDIESVDYHSNDGKLIGLSFVEKNGNKVSLPANKYNIKFGNYAGAGIFATSQNGSYFLQPKKYYNI